MSFRIPACIASSAVILDPNSEDNLSALCLRSGEVRLNVCDDEIARLCFDAADLIRMDNQLFKRRSLWTPTTIIMLSPNVSSACLILSSSPLTMTCFWKPSASQSQSTIAVVLRYGIVGTTALMSFEMPIDICSSTPASVVIRSNERFMR